MVVLVILSIIKSYEIMTIHPCMPPTMKMEQYNIAYIHAIASCCGWNLAREDADYDGIDISIHGRFSHAIKKREMRSQIDIQLKSTSTLTDKGDYFTYSLEAKNHNKLCGGNHYVNPRYLFVLDLGKDSSNWINFDANSISLSRHCYWVSLDKFQETSNSSKVTIKIPKSQLLTIDSLNKIMENASEGRAYEHNN